MSIRLEKITKRYPDFFIDVSFSAGRGEIVTLLGPSGCGKTTTLHIIAGFIKPDTGAVFLNDREVTALTPQERRVGLVFQDYSLFPNMNVYGNISFGPRMQGWRKKRIKHRVEDLLSLIRLPQAGTRNVSELSGGEQQRIALARALAPNPDLLLLDEPLSALDARLRKQLRGEIKRIQRELELTTVYVTHDQEEAFALSDRVVVMRDGRVEQSGTSFDIYNRPATRFVARFVGITNMLRVRVSGAQGKVKKLVSPEGTFFAVYDGPLAPGLEMTLLVRPEKCALNERPSGKNVVKGKITGCEYLGDTTVVTIALKQTSFSVKVFGPLECRTGEEVRVSFKPEDCWFLPD